MFVFFENKYTGEAVYLNDADYNDNFDINEHFDLLKSKLLLYLGFDWETLISMLPQNSNFVMFDHFNFLGWEAKHIYSTTNPIIRKAIRDGKFYKICISNGTIIKLIGFNSSVLTSYPKNNVSVITKYFHNEIFVSQRNGL